MEKVKSKSPVDMEKCMPTPPDRVGREFVRQYYTIMNMSPQHLYCFYTDNATFIHDDANANERRTISVEGKMAIRDMMADRLPGFQHTSTKIDQVDTMKTLDNGLLVQILGEISFNEQPMRSFSQTIILTPQTPFKYFVCNDIFRFVDFEDAVDDDLAIVTQPTVEKDWGTQCEEESEQTEPRVARAAEQNDNEVKLDNSDSGLSSDAEKVIMDMQSMNLKNILQESRSITKESVRIRSPLAAEVEPTQVESDDANQSGNRSQLFRDSCILTVGNVVNPNIEFEEENSAEKASDMSPDSMDTVRGANEDGQTSKGKQRKRNRRKHKADKSNDEPADGKPTESVHDTSESTESHETSTPENATEMSGEQPAQPDENPEQEPPKAAPEFKTYADLARGGNQPWVDELATRNEPVRPVERSKSRPSLVRRNSRNDKPSPPTEWRDHNRSSPKNDQLQVFIGNIPHSANEDDIRRMFSRFGRLTRVRLMSNTRKAWLARHAFISYEAIQSARNCLMNKHTFYWPENGPDSHKLNVNGDPSVDIWDEFGNIRTGDQMRPRDYRQSRNFGMDRDGPPRRSPNQESHDGNAPRSDRRRSYNRN